MNGTVIQVNLLPIAALKKISDYFLDVIEGDVDGVSISPREIGSPHYTDVTMSPMASQITSLGIVYSTVDSDADQR